MKIKKGARILKLTVELQWFEVMVTGEKPFEIRQDGNKWIQSRLFDRKTKSLKHYDYVQYTNGYGADRPMFICRYNGVLPSYEMDRTFSNGAKLKYKGKKHIIMHGEIVKIKNYKLPSKKIATVSVTEKRESKLYSDVSEAAMKFRVQLNKMFPKFSLDQMDTVLMKMQDAVAERAISSLKEKLKR